MNHIEQYMDENHVNCPGLAKALKDVGYPVSRHTVQSWRNGQVPKRKAWPFIEKATGGKVKPASFL